MKSGPTHPSPWSFEALPDDEQRLVLATVERLKRAETSSPRSAPLKGRTLAVLCDAATCPQLQGLQEAAAELGAQVAHIRPQAEQLMRSDKIEAMAALLGRLYDGIACHDLPPRLVERLERSTGKPVFASAGATAHVSAPADRFLLQALLLNALR
ncbi:MAG: hypothetical protein ABI605_14295 [Rhizobacter sp.]